MITKADHIDHASTIEDIVLGNDDAWSDWKPTHGWWPMSAKTHSENAKNDDERLIRLRETSLFLNEDRGWPDLQRRADQRFGTDYVRTKLYSVFERMVMRR